MRRTAVWACDNALSIYPDNAHHQVYELRGRGRHSRGQQLSKVVIVVHERARPGLGRGAETSA